MTRRRSLSKCFFYPRLDSSTATRVWPVGVVAHAGHKTADLPPEEHEEIVAAVGSGAEQGHLRRQRGRGLLEAGHQLVGFHVVERYELSEDGMHILLEFMLEDPEYFVAPMTHST